MIGGLGTSVAEVMAEYGSSIMESGRFPVFERHGVPGFGESGKADDLYRKYRLDTAGIAEKARALYDKIGLR